MRVLACLDTLITQCLLSSQFSICLFQSIKIPSQNPCHFPRPSGTLYTYSPTHASIEVPSHSSFARRGRESKNTMTKVNPPTASILVVQRKSICCNNSAHPRGQRELNVSAATTLHTRRGHYPCGFVVESAQAAKRAWRS
jgi:hypothetical protein